MDKELERRRKISESLKGKKKSESHCKRCNSKKGKKVIKFTNRFVREFVLEDELSTNPNNRG